MMEAVLVLAAVVQKFQLQPVDGVMFPTPSPILTLRPDAVTVRLVPR